MASHMRRDDERGRARAARYTPRKSAPCFPGHRYITESRQYLVFRQARLESWRAGTGKAVRWTAARRAPKGTAREASVANFPPESSFVP
eukprot:6177835-Pleurochrysis_carterae.AAC.2